MKIIAAWRLFFAVAALLIIIGGPQHPAGTMEQMLADPAWYPAHALVLAGFLALGVGLALLGRDVAMPAAVGRWRVAALAGTGLQALEMAFHTAAAVDHGNLVAGHSTPVLTTHLWLSIVLYPVFAITIVGFIIVAARLRVVASPWVAWIGVIGAAAHGAAAPLVVLFEVPWARILFPFIVLFALWVLLAAAWQPRARPSNVRPPAYAGAK